MLADDGEGICAGKQSVANYLRDYQGFSQLYLAPKSTDHLSNGAQVNALNGSPCAEERSFATVEALLDFITKQWQRRWVTVDMLDEHVLETLLCRPSFILVSVDAPVSLRWERFKERSI